MPIALFARPGEMVIELGVIARYQLRVIPRHIDQRQTFELTASGSRAPHRAAAAVSSESERARRTFPARE